MKKHLCLLFLLIATFNLHSYNMKEAEVADFPFELDITEYYEMLKNHFPDEYSPDAVEETITEVSGIYVLELGLVEIRNGNPATSNLIYSLKSHKAILKSMRRFTRWVKNINIETSEKITSIEMAAGLIFEDEEELYYCNGHADIYFISMQEEDGTLKAWLEIRFFDFYDKERGIEPYPYIFSIEKTQTFLKSFPMHRMQKHWRKVK